MKRVPTRRFLKVTGSDILFSFFGFFSDPFSRLIGWHAG
ncbi:hypothetical protein AcetOrient_orf00072p (plasmid) [Acetobacter orientalis]|uniref:Uncharacterized protein n=1 Tax=Acetobacter orientalis TaxID=146474 RepID=A0A2Z5ZMW1_9PROT|nr:hypothetical protein AcetOrient_orf00072p [Acetobacter orientalis]